MLACIAALSLGLAGPGGFIATPARQMEPLRLVTIDVAADAAYRVQAHQIQINTTAPTGNPTTEALAEREWTATRRQGENEETISSVDCPALRDVALSFRELPAVPIRPFVTQVGGDLPNGPTMKDGFVTSLTFDTVTTDNAMVSVHISGWGIYQSWGHESVSKLVPCWRPA
ncbi:hypothetical protein [Brevundimonas sp.]|uniref:hypothetical protein n=1 Tax=Brevundimonas sp. TaxID=1871086 RepID=UPI003D0A5A7E